MPVSFVDVINDFTPEEQAEIERGGAEIVAGNRMLRELRKILGVTQGRFGGRRRRAFLVPARRRAG